MELGHVVLGIPGHRSAVGPGHQVHEDAMRAGEGEADGEIVGRVHDDRLAADGQPDGEAGGEVVIAQHVLIPEHEVLGGMRRAVRPLDAFTQVEGVGRAVIGDFPGFSQIGTDIGAVHVVAHQLRVHEAVSEDTGIAGADTDAAPGAAVLTDLIQRFDHHWVGWEPLVHGGDFAVGDHIGQHGRFVVLGCGHRVAAVGCGRRFGSGRLRGGRVAAAAGSQHRAGGGKGGYLQESSS